MELKDFAIGKDFYVNKRKWRCTDIGTRTIAAIELGPKLIATSQNEVVTEKTLTYEEALAEGWFNGPPYAVVETLFDEYDIECCKPAP